MCWLIVVFLFLNLTHTLWFLLWLFFLSGTSHLVDGGKKNASYIASLFDPWITKLDPTSTKVDCVFFDGAANVQKAGRLLAAKYPRIHVQHCAAHSVSLFFSDITTKLWQIRFMTLNYRRVYRMFGSGAMHSPYALFLQQSKMFNGGRKVGLIRAADTRMAGHSYAQCRLLRLRGPLLATINSAAYIDLKLKGFSKKVEEYLSNPEMWVATFVIQRCLFPMIRVLRLCDKSALGGMSKIVYYVHKTDEAIEKSMDALNELRFFDNYDREDAEDVDGVDLQNDFQEDDESMDDSSVEEEEPEPLVDNTDDDTDDEDSEAEEETVPRNLGERIKSFWLLRRSKLITPLSLAAWYCCPHPDIRQDVRDHEIGGNRLDVETVIMKLFYPMTDGDIGRLIQTFWREFDQFQMKRGPSYSREWIWESDEISNGNCHLWHKLYSLPFTEVFGKVACRVTSKPLGCGLAERNWGVVKHLKTGKRAHLSSAKAQQQATIYGAACMERGRVKEETAGSPFLMDSTWTDADMAFQTSLGLENWNAVTGMVPAPLVVPRRIFKAWIEDWEFQLLRDNDVVTKAKFVQKYWGLKWVDLDHNELCVAEDLRYYGGRNGSGWCVIGKNVSDGKTEAWTLDLVIDEIADYTQDPELNVEVVKDEEKRAFNSEQKKIEQQRRQAEAANKRAATRK